MGRRSTLRTAYLVRFAFIVEMEGREMRKAPEPTKVQSAFQNHQQHSDSIKHARFLGTDNPRHLRALAVLLRRPLSRESLDSVAGASNSPDLVAELRRRGLDLPCERIQFIDRDGKDCRPGVYSLSEADRRKVHQWQARQGGQL